MSWCCAECCPDEQEPGILSGVDRDVPALDDTLTTFFHNEFRHKKILGNQPALCFYDRKITFFELHIHSSAVAKLLKDRLGDPIPIKNPDDDLLICICLPPSDKFIVLIFAILKIGGTYLPLDPTYPSSVILQILKNFRPAIVIHEEIQTVPQTSGEGDPAPFFITVEQLWKDLSKSGDSEAATVELSAKHDKIMEVLPLPQETRANERPAVIIHTTGLPQVPRGVRISHRSILNRIFWTWKYLPYVKMGTSCLSVPVTFVESLNQIFAALLKGVTLYIYNAHDQSQMHNFIDRLDVDKVTRISLSVVVLGKFLNECHVIGRDEARMRLKLLKYVTCKGEIISYELARRFFNTFPADGKVLATMYGYTELTGDVICERFKGINDVNKRFVAGHIVLGQPLDNVKIYVMNVNRELAVNLEQGQVCVAGTPLAMGYMNKRTKDFSFINNPYDNTRKFNRLFLTGDYGRYVVCEDKKYRLLLEGRGDSFLRHNGYEFVIEDIKDVLKKNEGVDHVNIFIFHPGKSDQNVLAFVQPKPDFISKLTNETVTTYLAEKVPKFMIPTIRVVEAFPVLENGRLDRHQLLNDYLQGRDSGFDDWGRLKLKNEAAAEPGKILLEALYKFCSIPVKLSIKNLSQSFYALGGTSCNTVCLVLYLNQQGFPICNAIQDFIGAETLEDLINLMENRKTLQNFRKSNQPNAVAEAGIGAQMQMLVTDSRAAKMYTTKYMEAKHQRETAQIVASTYPRRGDMEKIAMVSEDQLLSWLNLNWNSILEQQMSIVVIRNSDSKVVATALCYDFFTHLNSDTAIGPLKYVLEFREEVKGQVLEKLGGSEAANEIYECFMMGVGGNLTAGENVRVVILLIHEILARASSDGFKSVYIASSNQLIRDLLLEIFEFKLLDDYVVNEYEEAAGIRPFHLAPGTLTMSSYCKILKARDTITTKQ